MDTTPFWMSNLRLPAFSKLRSKTAVDVLVVGGGITGVTTALLLAKAGKSVALVEKDRIGLGQTGHTTAHVSYVTDSRLHELVSRVGKKGAQAFWEAGLAAMQQIEALATEHQIGCELRRVPSFLFAALQEDPAKERESLQKDARLAQEMDFDAEFIEQDPVFARPAVRFANQLKFHPLQYLAGLVQAFVAAGGKVYEETDASELEAGEKVLETPEGSVQFQQLVVATHMPIQGTRSLLPATLFQTKLAAYTSYAIRARLPKGEFSETLFWDTNDPYFYQRIDRDAAGWSTIVGGEDHKTGLEENTEERYASLEKTLRERFPDAVVENRWSGQVIETPDGLPYIGEVGEGHYLATGFSGNGMTLGTFSAQLIRDLILGQSSPWEKLFDPDRKSLSGTWEYLRENKDFPMCFIQGHLTPMKDSTDDLAPGEGAIAKVDGKKCAAYRDADGRLTVLSAVCPHLGCIVGWNTAEKTWDCPCHGSRFQPDGEVMAGPAESPLAKL